MNIPKRQRRGKSYRGCTHCRESRKKCSEERPCSYCIKTGHAASCEYVGLEALIRFDKKSAGPVVSRRKPASSKVSRKPSLVPELDSTETSILSTPSPESTNSWSCLPYSSNSSINLTRTPSPEWLLSNGTGFHTAEIPYIHYFVNRFFPLVAQPIAVYMIVNAMDHPILRHAIIAIAAMLGSRDPFEQPQPTNACIEQCLEHKQKTLHLVRHHLENEDIGGHFALAVAFLLLIEEGNPENRRVHLYGLKSVLEHLRRQVHEEEDLFLPPTISPLYWLSWSIGIRSDIGLAPIDGAPILDPFAFTVDYESRNRSWVAQMYGPTVDTEGVEWAILLSTFRVFLHRAFHVATTARKYRTSESYSHVDEAKIQRLCCELERDLDDWMSRRLIQHILVHSDYSKSDSTATFLNYPPMLIHQSPIQNLMIDYHMAKLYVSFISIPEIGPAHGTSDRFYHALEICRSSVANKIDPRWSHLADYTRSFQLFLCCLAFGGVDHYPLETKRVMEMIAESLSEDWGISVEDVFNRWAKHCPGLPPISTEKFPWIYCPDKPVVVDSVRYEVYC